ncbi:winged helix-turn-helix domain-containing protein [Actinokineospora enzanensis]|uniref:winged helix-turn-helix domain-containing protein n=1 Tax=Actinokineospora enzanensis TaxID=155975 RepID=UPI00036A4140|nr:winged helix-turn-helix domain-containing protein [Actinokineospora enzanensis]
MIHAGRTAVDSEAIAVMHGLSPATAHKRRPWTDPGHPKPITQGRPVPGRPRLWDEQQARAYANGEPIPALPTRPNERDLLDRGEAAALAGLTPDTWSKYQRTARAQVREGAPLVPPADEVVCGVDHWYRATVKRCKRERAARATAARGGRPPGSGDRLAREKIGPAVAELVHAARANDERVNVAEIARTLGIAYSTAHAHVKRLTGAT